MNNMYKTHTLDRRILSLLLAFTLLLSSFSGAFVFAEETIEDNKAFELENGLYSLKEEYSEGGTKGVTHYRYKTYDIENPLEEFDEGDIWNEISEFNIPSEDGIYIFEFGYVDPEIQGIYIPILIDDSLMEIYNNTITTFNEYISLETNFDDAFVATQLLNLEDVTGEQKEYAINLLKEKALEEKTITIEGIEDNFTLKVGEQDEFNIIVKLDGVDVETLDGFKNLLDDISWSKNNSNVDFTVGNIFGHTLLVEGVSAGSSVLTAELENITETFNVTVEEITGTIIIKYHDTDGNSIKDDLVETDVTGSKTYTAPEIEGYIRPSTDEVTLTIEFDGEELEHIFIYEEEPVVEPKGTITIKYHDTDGNSIKADLVETDIAGSKTYNAPEIEGYIKPSTDQVTLTIETDGQNLEHIFVYEKIEEILLEAPEVSLTFSDGKMNLVIDKKNEGKETTLLYKLSSEANFKEFDLNVNNLADETYVYNFKVRLGETDSEVVTFTLINENKKVADLKTELDKLVGMEVNSDTFITVKNGAEELEVEIEKLKHSKQKEFLTTELDKVYEKLEAFQGENSALAVELSIKNLSTTNLISKSSIDNILADIAKIDSPTVRATMLEKLGEQLAKNTHYNKENLNRVDTDINRLYDNFYAIGKGYLRVDRYDLGVTNDGFVIYMHVNNANENSNDYKNIELGELEEWVEGTIVEYMKDYLSLNNRGIEFRLFGSDAKEMKKITYSADILRRYDFEDFEEFKDILELNYEYLDFDMRIFNNNDEINIVLLGSFDKNDNDWRKRDTKMFEDYLKFNIAEPIVSETGKTVNIAVTDVYGDVLLNRSIKKSDIGNDYSDFDYLALRLASNYSNYENLNFTYQVIRGSRVVNIRMIGQNFRENSKSWENINENDFEDWIIEKVGKMTMAETDSDVNIKVYDSSRNLLIDIDLDKDDYIASYRDLEDDLNDIYDYFDGVYFEYIVRGSTYNTDITMEADVRVSSNEWKDLDMDEFEDWIRYEVVDYVASQIPRNISISLRDSRNSHIKSYSFQYEGLKELLEKEKDYNTNLNKFEDLEFTFNLSKEGSSVVVKLNGQNFRKSDSEWKDVSNKDFESWIEENIVTDLIKLFKGSVRVQVYDSKGSSLLNKTYRSDFLQTKDKEIIKDLEKRLKSDYKSFSDLEFEYSIKRDNSGDIIVSMRGKNFAEKDAKWKDLNKNDFDDFVKVVGNMVKLEFPKDDVIIEVVDRRGTDLLSKELTAIVNVDDIEVTKDVKTRSDILNRYIYLNEGLFESVSGNTKTFTIETGYINLLKNNTNLNKKALSVDMDEMATNVMKLPKVLINSLRSASANIGIGNNEVFVEVDTKTASNDVSIELKKAGNRANISGNTWLASCIYEVKSDLGRTAKDKKAISLTFHFEEFAKYRKGFGIYKQNEKTNIWELQAGKLNTLTNTITLNNPSDGKYALIYEGKDFADIQGSKYRGDILRLVDKGIINGKTETSFDPYSPVTRAEFVTMLVKGLGYDKGNPTTTPFKDVKTTDWFFRYVELARQNELVSGKSATQFAPNDNITREEVMTVLVRLNKKMASPYQSKQVAVPFGYNSSISNWAMNYVTEAKSVGIIDNDVTDFFGTQAPNRDETAHYIYNLLKINGQY